MFCPTCQAVSRAVPADRCPTCGGNMRVVTAADAVEVVEATAEVGVGKPTVDAESPLEADVFAVARPSARSALPMPTRLAELSVMAWRQPAIRAVVKTGASALALSLAMRAARQMLVRPAARRAVARAALPSLGDLLQPETPDNRARGAVVSETFIYMRRVVRG